MEHRSVVVPLELYYLKEKRQASLSVGNIQLPSQQAEIHIAISLVVSRRVSL